MSEESPTARDPSGESNPEELGVDPLITSSREEASESPDLSQHLFECTSCGYVYDPSEGVKKLGINPGSAFLDLDQGSFRCPVCRAGVDSFRDIGPRTRPSGFEENLVYGFGANSLTPGQKNVLIFGGLALIVAFFLSLYSLG